MNKEEQIVIDHIRFEEGALKEIALILDEAIANGEVFTAETFKWDNEISVAETLYEQFAEKAPIFKERLELLVERWKEMKKKFK